MSRLTSPLRRAGKSVARILTSVAIHILGIDRTHQITLSSTLVIAPHPDDETLGCGATIARMRSLGTPVSVLIISDGGQSPRPDGMTVSELLAARRGEAEKALASLGVDASRTRMLDFPDGCVGSSPSALHEAVREAIAANQVSQVMVTSQRDRHPDHAAVAKATLDVITRHFPAVRLYEYAVWQRLPGLTIVVHFMHAAIGRQHGWLAMARPHLVATEGFLEHKRVAMAAYESQLPHFPLDFLRDFFTPFETFTVGNTPLVRSGAELPSANPRMSHRLRSERTGR